MKIWEVMATGRDFVILKNAVGALKFGRTFLTKSDIEQGTLRSETKFPHFLFEILD